MLCHLSSQSYRNNILCLDEQGNTIDFAEFWQDVAGQQQAIAALQQQTWLLWQQDSYQFLVLFFAALLAGKKLILPPHRVASLEQQWAAQQVYFLTWQNIQLDHATVQRRADAIELDDALMAESSICFFTSGSTGVAKQIPRNLKQLLLEVQGLEEHFSLADHAIAVASVSHQHIYGLLFKLLWPLSSGRGFYRKQLAFPEDIVQAQTQLQQRAYANYVVASPAVLKRWGADVRLQRCQLLLSSGGRLPSGVRAEVGHDIVEILGSSETGGIAYRQQDEALWQAFANVKIAAQQEQLLVKTAHAYQQDWIATGDRIDLVGAAQTGSFRLLGRVDRIVKLEEKRISLDEIEHEIQQLAEVEQCHVLLLTHQQRQLLAAVVVLTATARHQLIQEGKAACVKALKHQLQQRLEGIAIPKKWRFLQQLPQNAQAKLSAQQMRDLFVAQDLPVLLTQQTSSDAITLTLEFPPELRCFVGHFPDYPIYPGVGQIAFIQSFAKNHWSDLGACCALEQIKFQKVIQPYALCDLQLQRKHNKIIFSLTQHDDMLASGRLVFQTDALA
ncbi:AMP-binding protein [Acinetobacter larvae]|uniref:Acyl-CoA synthetase n=1 Tax=Acinetobacter larvae TaxID=1789224 RepID=A0A1B2M278_9GAMM|nr:AMP-binding protein [Acinetobacter larvae]AOA59292.1 acyl-CoA synthetase [Acinetobacter larvae]